MARSTLRRLAAATVIMGGIVFVAPPAVLHGSASATVAHMVFNPVPIGTSYNTAVGARISVSITAKDSAYSSIPGAQFYVSFNQAIGGGTAFVGTTILGRKPLRWTADSTGKVIVTYTAPPKMAKTGADVLRAENGATVSTSTLKVDDSFCYTKIASMGFTPKPVAPKGTLPTHATVPMTLTAFGSNGLLASGATVYLHFNPAVGGGTAMVGTTALTKTPKPFVTDSNGQVHISYTTPSTLPATGAVDSVEAGNETVAPCASSHDSYSY
jgi:hypothetical protein